MTGYVKTFFIIIIFTGSCWIHPEDASGRSPQLLQTKEITVWFDTSLDIPAKGVVDIFPVIRKELEAAFEWEFYQTPGVLLVKQRDDFLQMTDNPIAIAFASPERNLIVIDYSKMTAHRFTMPNTLKHEFCHILLHQHIATGNLPKWLDEGLCQWASQSIDEILDTQKQSALNGVTLSQRKISFTDLEHRFPDDLDSRLLAYAASKRFVAFLMDTYGKPKIMTILKYLEKGQDIETSTLSVLSKPLNTLEHQWHKSLKGKAAWLTFMGHYLYEILFAMMGMLTFYGFIRSRIRKKRYRDEEGGIEDDGSNDTNLPG